MTDEFERGQLDDHRRDLQRHVRSERGAGAIRFAQLEIATEDPVFVDMDGSVIKMNFPAKLPTTAATYAAWVISSGQRRNGWVFPASIVQGSRLGRHGVPHFHAEGDSRIRLTIRNEAGQDIVGSNGAPWGAHPFPNQPEIDVDPNTPPEPWPANEWFHLAATYDQNANGGVGTLHLLQRAEKIRGGAQRSGCRHHDRCLGFPAPLNYYDGLGIGAVYDSGGRRLHGMMDELYIFSVPCRRARSRRR